jgi:hypothetical protein
MAETTLLRVIATRPGVWGVKNNNRVEYKKLYGFTAGKKDKFAKITFKNTEVMNRVKNLWYSYKEGQERVKSGFKFLASYIAFI